MSPEWAQALRDAEAHAARELPREACGLLIRAAGVQYVPCRNTSAEPDGFTLHPDDYVAAEAHGEVVAVFHSHDGPPEPSARDIASQRADGLPWVIFGEGRWLIVN